MVLLSGFTVTVIDPINNEPYPEIIHNGKTYLVARPGGTFKIKIVASPVPPPCWLATISVDSISPGYDLAGRPVIMFDGFLRKVSAEGFSMSVFKFADISTATAGLPQTEVDNPALIKQGKIDVSIYQARSTGRMIPLPEAQPPIQHHDSVKLPEGKKFFLAPSLAVAEGDLAFFPSSQITQEYEKILRVASAEIFYETADTLILRKILDPENPVHAKIIHDSRSQPAADASSQMTAIGGRTSASIKIESTMPAGTQSGSSTSVQVVDLTKKRILPQAIKVNGKRVAEDEIAVCDLTRVADPKTGHQGGDSSSMGEGASIGAWTIKKKESVTID